MTVIIIAMIKTTLITPIAIVIQKKLKNNKL